MATAHKVEVKGVARPSRPGPGRDALVTLPQLYEQLRYMVNLNIHKLVKMDKIIIV